MQQNKRIGTSQFHEDTPKDGQIPSFGKFRNTQENDWISSPVARLDGNHSPSAYQVGSIGAGSIEV
jgi:hypothetical protein